MARLAESYWDNIHLWHDVMVERKRPDKHKNTAAWNKSWEDDVQALHSQITVPALEPFPPSSTAHMSEEAARAMQNQFTFETVMRTREIRHIQEHLAMSGIAAFVGEGFENAWRALPLKVREKHCLEGIYRAACAIPEEMTAYDSYRMYCPELTIVNLAGNSPTDFIHLLKQLLPPNMNSRVNELANEGLPAIQTIPNAKVNQILSTGPLSTPLDVANSEASHVWRCNWLSHAILGTLDSFYGRAEPPLVVVKGKHSLFSKHDENAPKSSFTADDFVIHKETHNMKGLSRACWTCQKLEEELVAEGRKLLACTNCHKHGRSVYYCSRDCQRRDWKTGFPVAHKKICGRPDTDMITETLRQERVYPLSDTNSSPSAFKNVNTLSADLWFPLITSPDPGFQRSPHLLFQISLLNGQEPDLDICDYFFIDAKDFVQFLALRRRAMRTGDRGSVFAMFSFLQPLATSLRFNGLRSQLEREYGVSLSGAVVKAAPESDEDIDVAASRGLQIMNRGMKLVEEGIIPHDLVDQGVFDLDKLVKNNLWPRWSSFSLLKGKTPGQELPMSFALRKDSVTIVPIDKKDAGPIIRAQQLPP
ncbi:hypothetical protein FISHEDRAFT_72052 [Fistulina hepatica ATCC 64428]|uniref:MYND-type domain-containing protein n=1 Tax=Fistulina hepatica ATCC 64428 TaxID=1128425 RepID=A0A0D7AFV1_9AGAR|nr:hypothetical protein FISHEDRAFT_72052 [Fistulina hepatica ATCC 64428]